MSQTEIDGEVDEREDRMSPSLQIRLGPLDRVLERRGSDTWVN